MFVMTAALRIGAAREDQTTDYIETLSHHPSDGPEGSQHAAGSDLSADLHRCSPLCLNRIGAEDALKW